MTSYLCPNPVASPCHADPTLASGTLLFEGFGVGAAMGTMGCGDTESLLQALQGWHPAPCAQRG